jgi:23S rRNA A1618 N6-methylase RlmF
MHTGCGASCIYALLGTRLHTRWSFTVTELDTGSLDVARANVKTNGLEPRIRLVSWK